MIENVTIVGMGALGILYGDLMERTLGPGHVRFIAEGERLTRLQQEGAWCNGRKCDFTVTDNTGEEAELLLFAVKMTALDEAMELAAPLVGEDTVILSLLNGVTSEEHIGQTFGPGKILYCVAQGMDAVREDNRLAYTQAGKLYLGLPEEDYFDRGEKLDAVLEFLQRAGVPAEREPGEILHHAQNGCRAFVILQPFGCLPNHVVGRGIAKRLKELTMRTTFVRVSQQLNEIFGKS